MVTIHNQEPADRDIGDWESLLTQKSMIDETKILPLQSASPFSFLTYTWANGFIQKAYKEGLTEDDLYDTPDDHSAEQNAARFEELWEEEVAKKGTEKASLIRVIIRMVKFRLLMAVILNLTVNTAIILRTAYFLRQLLKLIETPGSSYESQVVYVMMITFCSVIRTTTFSGTFSLGSLAGIQVRAGVLSLVFKRIMYQRMHYTTVGNLVNLCANDGQRLYEALLHAAFAVSAIPVIGASIYAVHLLGPWGIFGFVVFFAFIPFQTFLSRLVFAFRQVTIPITEERVKLMSEIITAVKLVKMYAWETSFAKKIYDIRKKEINVIEKSLLTQSLLSGQPTLVPIIAAVATFLAMTLSKVDLTVTQAFVFISLLNTLRLPLTVMPFCLKSVAEGLHVCARIKTILIARDEEFILSELANENNLIEIRNGYFGWKVQLDSDEKSKKSKNYGSTKKAEGKRSSQQNNNENLPLLSEQENDYYSAEDTIVTLHDITLSLPEGSLLGICGGVGSGKTSIIQAILGMMRQESGEIAINQSKKIAYVPQQAWIMNTTVKENILFGKSFDADKYQRVAESCALLSDFKQLPAGDQTEIGERGINLSGGQKQRISLARAVYSDADLILLDDPLSAVDAHVGQHIFTKCLKGTLKDKTVLFVTHQLQFLTDCDNVLVMKDGQIAEEGTHESLMRDEDGEYSNLIRSFHDGDDKSNQNQEESDVSSVESADEFDDNTRNSSLENERRIRSVDGVDRDSKQQCMIKEPLLSNTDEMTDKEKDEEDAENAKDIQVKIEKKISDNEGKTKGLPEESSKIGIIKSYIQAAGGPGAAFLVLFVYLLYTGSQVFVSYWISYWIQAGSGGTYVQVLSVVNGTPTATMVLSQEIIDNPKLGFYQMVYGFGLIILLTWNFLYSRNFMKFCLRASCTLHQKIFKKIVNSPMRFFDVTPSGQILNRFSKDMDEVDSGLPFQSDVFFKNCSVVIGAVILIIMVEPLFVLTAIPIIGMLILISSRSKKAIHLTKQIESATKSPLFSHIAASVQGIRTIKAYKKESDFLDRFNKLQDKNNMALFLFDMTIRWMAVRVDSTCSLIIASTFFLITLIPGSVSSPAMAGLALTYAISISDIIQYTLRLCFESDAKLSSVERIDKYIKKLESEAPAVIDRRRPHRKWPKEGAIRFENVDVRYRDGLPLVLKDLCLDIKPQEKIGIVGRTGSGKSSLAMVLFRMMELDGGKATIDGIDISSIGLEDLRSKLSIIPQDPVLFVGTVRYNLDPFGKYSDAQLWSALNKCHVRHTIQCLDGQLDAPIVENGENFSVGERQLLCMARALLRKSKVLVLDEATAAIDTETDSLIQETIKEAFSDCTMLTIAHRLNTVVNNDRILVLDDGKVSEFAEPEKLLADKFSVFSGMMAAQESQKRAAIGLGSA